MIRILCTCSFLAFALFFSSCKGSKEGKTPSGFSFLKHTSGTGQKPKTGDMASIHVTIFKDSTEVGSTYDQGRPMEIPIQDPKSVNPMQRPIAEGVMLMAKGDSMTVTWNIDTVSSLPPELADAKVLRYSIKMVDIVDSLTFNKKMTEERGQQEKTYAAVTAAMTAMAADSNAVKASAKTVAAETKKVGAALKAGTQAGMKTSASGIKYVILRPGKTVNMGAGAVALVHYFGALTDGTRFDDSYSRGQPIPVEVGKGGVIPGWDEALATLLPEGCAAVVLLPSKLAYGEQAPPGSPIKPGDDLVFYMEPLQYIK